MSNYPDGIDGSDDAFNAPDPWEGKTCGTCANCKVLWLKDDESFSWACCYGGELNEVDATQPACEVYEVVA